MSTNCYYFVAENRQPCVDAGADAADAAVSSQQQHDDTECVTSAATTTKTTTTAARKYATNSPLATRKRHVRPGSLHRRSNCFGFVVSSRSVFFFLFLFFVHSYSAFITL